MSYAFRFLFLVAIVLVGTRGASAQELTVMELLQNPRQFEGRRVTVRGYYYSDFEGHGIFADRKAAEKYETERGIYVSADPDVKSPVRKARISGVFFYSRLRRPGQTPPSGGYGTFGLYSSALINCTVHLQRESTPAPNQAMQRTPARRSRSNSHD